MAGRIPNQGQKAISLADWRRFLRVADWWDRTHGHMASVTQPGAVQPLQIQNATGGALSLGSVVKLGDKSLNSLEATRLFFDGGVPDGYMDRIAITKATAPNDGDIVPVDVVGVTLALVAVSSTSHSWCSVTNGQHYFTSGSAGQFPILNAPTETGLQLCAVMLDRRGNANDDFYYSSTGLSGGTYHSFSESASNAALIATVISHATDTTAWEIDNSNNVLICKKAGAWTVHGSLVYNCTETDSETTVWIKTRRGGTQTTLEQAKRTHPVAGSSGVDHLDSVALFAARDFLIDDQLYLQCATDSYGTAAYQLDVSFLLTRMG